MSAGIGPVQYARYAVVYYADRGTSAWWTRFLDRDFIHVEVWWEIGDDYWVALRPAHCYMTCDVMFGGPREGENGVTAVQLVDCLRGRADPMWLVGLKTCVTAVKAVVGVRDARIITPRQLFNHLNSLRRVIP